jgi:hypothetical protein
MTQRVIAQQACGTIDEFRFLSWAAEQVMLREKPLPPHPMASNGRDRFACYAEPKLIRNKYSNSEPMVITIVGQEE